MTAIPPPLPRPPGIHSGIWAHIGPRIACSSLLSNLRSEGGRFICSETIAALICVPSSQVCKENCATSVQCTCSWYNNQCRDAVQLASQGLSDLVGGAVGLAMWLLVLLIAVPAVILLLIIICIVWCCCCRNKGQVQ